MRTCPSCGSPEVVTIQTCRRANGNRWRRHRCTACDFRTSSTEIDAFAPLERPITVGRACYEKRSLTDRQAAFIILSDETEVALAARFNISRGSVNAIRRGIAYRNVWNLLQQLQPDDPAETTP